MAVSEMTESLQRVGERPLELSVEERNLLSVAYGPETIEIPQSLSDVRGVVQNIGTDSGSSVGSTQQQHNHYRKQQWQQAEQTEEEEKEEGERGERLKEERRKKGTLRNKSASGSRRT